MKFTFVELNETNILIQKVRLTGVEKLEKYLEQGVGVDRQEENVTTWVYVESP